MNKSAVIILIRHNHYTQGGYRHFGGQATQTNRRSVYFENSATQNLGVAARALDGLWVKCSSTQRISLRLDIV